MPAIVQMPPEDAKLLLLSALAPAGAPKRAAAPPPPSPPRAPQRKVLSNAVSSQEVRCLQAERHDMSSEVMSLQAGAPAVAIMVGTPFT